MFDDVPENLPTGDAKPAAEGGQAPPTLNMPEAPEPEAPVAAPAAPPAPESGAPVAEPKDMFEAGGQPVEGGAPTPELPPTTTIPEPRKGGSKAGKIAVVVVLVLVILGLAGGAVAWFIGGFASTINEMNDLQDIAEEQQERAAQEDADSMGEDEPTMEDEPDMAEPEDKLPEEESPRQQEVDSDGDGLSDAEEAAIGTSTFKPDTDNDGLFDYEEVYKYNTNPLNPDTDGDGFLDGEEVRNGYNPAGPGELFQVPASE